MQNISYCPVHFPLTKEQSMHAMVTQLKFHNICLYFVYVTELHLDISNLSSSSLNSVRVNNVKLHSIPQEFIRSMDYWYAMIQNIFTPSLDDFLVSPRVCSHHVSSSFFAYSLSCTSIFAGLQKKGHLS
jgi:hypothetical protein